MAWVYQTSASVNPEKVRGIKSFIIPSSTREIIGLYNISTYATLAQHPREPSIKNNRSGLTCPSPQFSFASITGVCPAEARSRHLIGISPVGFNPNDSDSAGRSPVSIAIGHQGLISKTSPKGLSLVPRMPTIAPTRLDRYRWRQTPWVVETLRVCLRVSPNERMAPPRNPLFIPGKAIVGTRRPRI